VTALKSSVALSSSEVGIPVHPASSSAAKLPPTNRHPKERAWGLSANPGDGGFIFLRALRRHNFGRDDGGYFFFSTAVATQHVTLASPHLLQLCCMESVVLPLTTVISPLHSPQVCLEPTVAQ